MVWYCFPCLDLLYPGRVAAGVFPITFRSIQILTFAQPEGTDLILNASLDAVAVQILPAIQKH